MFDQIGDMPLHPLVIHAAVVGVPLAFLLSLLFAFPRTRAWARWPLAVTVVGATTVVFVATRSGKALQASLGLETGNPVGDLIAKHSTLGDQLGWIMIGFSAIALVNVFALRATRTADGTVSAAGPAAPVRIVLLVALIAVGAAAMFWTVRVGDLGARAVWNPTAPGPFF